MLLLCNPVGACTTKVVLGRACNNCVLGVGDHLMECTPAEAGRQKRVGVLPSGVSCRRCPAGVAGQLAGSGDGQGSCSSLSLHPVADSLSTRGTGVNMAWLAASAYASWLLHGEDPAELSSCNCPPAAHAALKSRTSICSSVSLLCANGWPSLDALSVASSCWDLLSMAGACCQSAEPASFAGLPLPSCSSAGHTSAAASLQAASLKPYSSLSRLG